MGYWTSEDRENEIKREVQALRLAASQICKIKKVVLAFDGKVYNCKFDNAIKELSGENNRFYSNVNYYGYFSMTYYSRENANKDVTMLYCRKATKGEETLYFDGNKRIKASAMIEALNEKYAECLKRATELENAMQTLQATFEQLEALKKSFNIIVDAIPSQITSIYNIKRIY